MAILAAITEDYNAICAAETIGGRMSVWPLPTGKTESPEVIGAVEAGPDNGREHLVDRKAPVPPKTTLRAIGEGLVRSMSAAPWLEAVALLVTGADRL